MTAKHLGLVCAWVCLQAPLSHAQDADSLTRAQRDAANPLRMIIEASKLKPRQKAVDAEPVAKPPAEKLAARPAAGKPAAVLPPPAAGTSADRVPETAVASAEATPPRPEAAVASPQPSAPAASTLPTEPPAAISAARDDVQAPVPEPPAAPARALKAEAEPAMTAPASVALSPAASAKEALQLADYVEPVLPERVRRRLQADGEVVVQFTVNADGSVADASVRSSSDRALDAISLEAVRQWRYRPVASAQTHAVQLVFRVRE